MASTMAYADRDNQKHKDKHSKSSYPKKDYRQDKRYHHHRYPRSGHSVATVVSERRKPHLFITRSTKHECEHDRLIERIGALSNFDG